MDALTFMWSHFALFCVLGSIIAVAIENAKEHKEKLKRAKRETRKLANENEYLRLMNELKGVKM